MIRGNFHIQMRQIKGLKTKLSNLKQSLELMEDILEEKENDLKPENVKFKTKIKELSEYQIDPDRVNIKLFKLEDHSRSCNLRIGGVRETSNGEWEKCEEYLETLLQDELGIEENIIIEREHRTNSSPEGRRSKPRTIFCDFHNYTHKVMVLKMQRN